MSDQPPVPGLDPIEMMEAGHPVFLVGETMTRNIMAAAHGEAAEWRVVVGINGKWNHGAEDRQVFMFSLENAVEVAMSLVGAVLGSTRDQAVLDRVAELFGDVLGEEL